MFLVSRLDIENQKVEIIYADCKNESNYAKLSCMQKIFDSVTMLKQNRDIIMQIIDDKQVNVYQRGFVFGKDLVYVYQILETNSLHCDDEDLTEEA